MARKQYDRLVDALKARHWTIDTNHRSQRYTAMMPTDKSSFARKAHAPDYEWRRARFFVGRSGALRFSGQGTSGTSMSRPNAKMQLLREVPA